MNVRHFLSLGLLGCFAGCLSPTLPLPPPDEPHTITAGAEPGVFVVRGDCSPGALVLIKNADTGLYAGNEDTDGDGRYLIHVEGELCDRAEVLQIEGTATSGSTGFLLELRLNGSSENSCR